MASRLAAATATTSRPPSIPIAPELCDGLDNDCDGALQETDDDNDGERGCDGDCDDGDPLRYTGAPERCNGLDDDCDTVVPTNETDTDNDNWRVCDDDCLDGNATVNPGADELCDGLDTDCDTVIPVDEFDGDTDLFLACEDCNDSNLLIYPGAPELCDELDNDCDTIVPADEVDIDMDNFLACEECDDALATTFPGAPELCDGLDNDCDSVVPAPETTDVDLDNWVLCADCDDNDGAVNPGASEVCDGVDTDCDTLISPDELVDDDFDLYPLCDDCDDTLPGVNPGAAEVCDGLDTDCDGVIPATETDDDFDTFIECDGTDCDDGNIDVYLGAPEECYDAVDNDCDTFVNQGCACPIWGTASTTGICAGLGDYDCPYVGAQLAIDAAALDGACNDTWLHPGTYIESLFIEDDGELGSPGPATAVIIDGAASRTVEVDTNVVYTIETVTITGGAASEGAGLLAEDATVELNDVVFDSNACAGGGAGGGVFCDDCSLTVTNSTFIGNSCGYGGGGADNDGGAIHVTGGGSSFISGNIFEGNTAGDGGALWLEEASGGYFHVVTQNHFRENDTSDTGVGFFAFDGGAVAVAGDRVVLTNNMFFGNASTQGAGGVSLSASAGGATYVSSNVFVYNASGSGQGGGIHLESGTRWNGSPNVHNNVLGWNTGWGIYAESTMPGGVDYNDYTGNSSGAFAAGALFVPSQAGSIFVDPLFVALTDDGDYTNDDFTLQPRVPVHRRRAPSQLLHRCRHLPKRHRRLRRSVGRLVKNASAP